MTAREAPKGAKLPAWRRKDAPWHEVGAVGRYAAFWHEDTETITIFCADHKLWKFVLDCDAGLSDLDELTNHPGMTVDEIRWCIHIAASVETILEHAPHDLHRYGAVGVTF